MTKEAIKELKKKFLSDNMDKVLKYSFFTHVGRCEIMYSVEYYRVAPYGIRNLATGDIDKIDLADLLTMEISPIEAVKLSSMEEFKKLRESKGGIFDKKRFEEWLGHIKRIYYA